MSKQNSAKLAEEAALKQKRLLHVRSVLSERILEAFKGPDGSTKFTDAFEKHPGSIGLSSIMEEGSGDGKISAEMYDLYKRELRKFEAAFLRANFDKIDTGAVSEIITYDASLELLDEGAPQFNLELVRGFGVSTEFHALK
jgi:hypothetical protein